MRVRPGREDDDPRVVTIYNAIYPDVHVTVERYRHDLARSMRHPQGDVERYVAEEDGPVVGVMKLERHPFFSRPGSYYAEILVDPERWGHGIGSRLNAVLEDRAAARGAARLYGEIKEGIEEARRFVEARGYVPTGRVDRMSRLPVSRVNLEGYEGLEERLASQGITVRSIAEIGIDDDFLRAVQTMEFESDRDIPSAEEPGQPMPYELWKDDKLFAPDRSLEMFWVALHGRRPIGVARVARRGDRILSNGYTGVDREYRGRGVARLLKLKTIQFAQRNGYEWMYTGNDIENTRMLAINRRLGYEPLPGILLMVKELVQGEAE